jgi:hypothetical protein
MKTAQKSLTERIVAWERKKDANIYDAFFHDIVTPIKWAAFLNKKGMQLSVKKALEIQEEIGSIRIVKVIPLEKFTSDTNNFEYHTYLIVVDEEFIPKLNDEHRGYAWTELDDHPKPLHPGVWRTFNFKSIIDKIKTVEKVIAQPQMQTV